MICGDSIDSGSFGRIFLGELVGEVSARLAVGQTLTTLTVNSKKPNSYGVSGGPTMRVRTFRTS